MPEKRREKLKKTIIYLAVLILFPAVAVAGALIFDESRYMIVAVSMAILSCVPFAVSFEKKPTAKLVPLAIMTALSVAGRAVFAAVPFFKPVTAIVIICGVYLGAEAGFICGSVSAFVSNFIFSQGPWTPFQMLAWGSIGFISALISKPLRESRFCICAAGAISGFYYSFVLDVYSVLWADNAFRLPRYIEMLIASAPMTIVYAASNVVFLLLLAVPFGKKLDRLCIKYGM